MPRLSLDASDKASAVVMLLLLAGIGIFLKLT